MSSMSRAARLAGRSASWLAEAGADYARHVLPGVLRPEMVAQIDWHRDNGHELVIVSASLDAYLGPFGAHHGFDEVIGVTLAVDDRGVLTGDLARPNVRGPEKAVRLREWLAGDEPAFVWSYGNSSGDRELLELADQPVWVGRRRRTPSADGSRAQGADPGQLTNPTRVP
jgi:phosphatidylglycerophosphatase C